VFVLNHNPIKAAMMTHRVNTLSNLFIIIIYIKHTVNNFDFRCNNGNTVSGVGSIYGAWSEWVQCPTGSAICGVKTQVVDQLASGDDTALNQATFYCCSTE
jgi:hypothetical protein